MLKAFPVLLLWGALLGACASLTNAADDQVSPLAGRFLDIDGPTNIGEVTTARTHRGDVVTTQLIMPRTPGLFTAEGQPVAAAGLWLKIDCAQSTWVIERMSNYDVGGAVISNETRANPSASSGSPYQGLVIELCARTAPSVSDFSSFAEFLERARTRRGLMIVAPGAV